MKISNKIVVTCLTMLLSANSMAEQGGGVVGRTLSMNGNQGNTAESFYRKITDGSQMGVRATHRYNEKLIVYGDFLKADASDDSEDSIDAKGDGYGAGAIYFLPGRMEGYDMAVRGSYHT